jgi:hypothetical protein
MDYKELLRKYINYVEDCEGVNFITDLPRKPPFVDVVFTDEEWAELEKIKTEK